MAIISAGVIMNVFLAFAFFSYTYTNEREELPPVLGAVSAGSVAYEAGFAPATRSWRSMIARTSGYTELRKKIALSSQGQVLHFQVKRLDMRG